MSHIHSAKAVLLNFYIPWPPPPLHLSWTVMLIFYTLKHFHNLFPTQTSDSEYSKAMVYGCLFYIFLLEHHMPIYTTSYLHFLFFGLIHVGCLFALIETLFKKVHKVTTSKMKQAVLRNMFLKPSKHAYTLTPCLLFHQLL